MTCLALALSSPLLATATPTPTAAATATATAKPTTLTVGAASSGRVIPPGFLGLSIEVPGLAQYAGDDPAAPNPIMIQLIKNLNPGQRPVLRIGGDSTDWSWWPVRGVARPRGIRFTITDRWMAISHAVTAALNARLILGINLEADNARVAGGEAQALLRGLGRQYIDALELGNEPELYSAFAWYKLPNGKRVLGRPLNWDYAAFERDYASIARALPHGVPLAAPSIGSPAWSPNLGSFLSSQPRTALATLHRYPLKRCHASTHLTAGQLLSTASSTGLADGLRRYVTLAHSHRIPLRIDEMNSISCGGQHGLSDSYTSSLWALDALYEMARVGVDGVNIHTAPNARNELFYFHHLSSGWIGVVRPLYYGMLMFAHAAPAGSRILPVAGRTPASVRVWATRTSDGAIRVVLINDGSAAHTAAIRIPGSANGPAILERLRAPGITALSGITLGGQSLGASTTTGLLAGPPDTATVTPNQGAYRLSLPLASAALLTVARH